MKTEQPQTVTAEHRQRDALVYVRPAVTPHVVEQTDKVKHRYALRNLSNWQRLLDACARTDTLLGSEDALHKPQALRS